MKEIITNIINKWDPMNLFPYAPDNEYESEVNSIIRFLSSKKNIELISMKNALISIFFDAFNDDYFLSDNGEKKTNEIAYVILKEISHLEND